MSRSRAIRDPLLDGTVTTPFTIGSNLYVSDTFHANAIHYIPFDDSFTIADRNPDVVVKVSATGSPQWQLGGSCDDAPVAARCSTRDWQVIHGHHLLEDGTFVVFNNGLQDELAHVVDLKLSAAPAAFTATLVKDYTGDASSLTLGDVQRLPGGNTLVTYSGDGRNRRARCELERSPGVVRARRLHQLASDALRPADAAVASAAATETKRSAS